MNKVEMFKSRATDLFSETEEFGNILSFTSRQKGLTMILIIILSNRSAFFYMFHVFPERLMKWKFAK